VDGFVDGGGVGVMVGVGVGRLGVVEGTGVGVTVAVCVPVHPVMRMISAIIAIETNNDLFMLLYVWHNNLITYRAVL